MQKRMQEYLIFGASVIFTAILFVYGFYQFDATGRLAFDRRILHNAVRNWEFGNGMSNPPWSVAIIYPFEQLPLKLTWGLLAFLLFAVVILWIPPYRHWTRYLLLVILPISYPTLRNYAEGNYEAFVLWGLLAIYFGYQKQNPFLMAFGVLLATIKVQACVLLVAMLPWYIRDWDWKKQKQFYLAIAVWVIPIMLLYGTTWLDSLSYFSRYHGSFSIVDLELPFLIEIIIRGLLIGLAVYVSPQLTRASMSLLIVTSLIISPYTGSLSTIILLTIGVGTLFSERKWGWGILLLILYQELYIFLGSEVIGNHAYILSLFFVTYGIFLWELLRENRLEVGQKHINASANSI